MRSSSEALEWRLRERDLRLLTGRGRYINDIKLLDMLYCTVVGSRCPHAKIKRIDVSKARALNGVVAVLTGDMLKNIMKPLPPAADYRAFGWHWRLVETYPLAVDKVRFVGEPVVAIAAVDEYTAADAAELVEIEYEPLKPVVNPLEAMKPESPLLYEEWGDNIQAHIRFRFGDVAAAFAKADRIIKVRWREARQSGFPIEPRGIVAQYNAGEKTITVWSSTQSPALGQLYIAKALGMPTSSVRVFAPDIGGGFGNKLHWWLDLIPCLLSMKTGKPVKLFETRYQNFLSQPHQRDVVWNAEAAVRNDGRILALRALLVIDYGVEGTNKGTGAPSIVPASLSTPNAYKLEAVDIDAYGVVTNKSFYCAYRGYGKDKGVKLMERVMQRISVELGIPPEEVRFRNFIQPSEFPYKQVTGYVFDSGNYPETLRRALELLDIGWWRKRQEELRREGRYIGIGVVFAVEPAGAAIPNSFYSGYESARVSITADGSVEVYTGMLDIGQGSSVAIAQAVSETLGVPISWVKVFSGSSDYLGSGTYASRGAVYGVGAVIKASRILRERLTRIMAHLWDARPEDVEIANGELVLKPEPERRIRLDELAQKLYHFPGQHRLLSEELLREGVVPLDVTVSWFSPITSKDPTATYTTVSCSADIAVVEVDAETGEVKILKYVTVHDAGRVINHQIVEGQVVGGVAQGIGGALYEELIYNEDGLLTTASFADYLMPSALEMPSVEMSHVETPSPFTELGSKGMSEGPAYSSTVAIANAVEDALTPFGVAVEEIPLTPERVRRLIKHG
ncbi:MAG: xanthine dehydrogenase family protein molybdopterin-binding subunit [Aigarchaeota archaeon]|nr:xanthine dehydrogenase family protein molybdopterin-binding subunit [Candidatus Pelearchaeum maunauluense]